MDYLTDALAACNGNLDLTELVEDLFRSMTISWHFCLPSIHPVSGLSTGYVRGDQVSLVWETSVALLPTTNTPRLSDIQP